MILRSVRVDRPGCDLRFASRSPPRIEVSPTNTPMDERIHESRRHGDLIMGLDLALAGLVLVTAIRGWLKGFVAQAVRLVGLVSAVYVAAPIRDQVKPYAVSYLPTVRADLVDRLFWWVSACVAYFVLVGVTSLLVSVSKRPALGIKEPNRNDQFAGLSLGVMKGTDRRGLPRRLAREVR